MRDIPIDGIPMEIQKTEESFGAITEVQAQDAERNVAIVNRMKAAALDLTKSEHWTDFGGNCPYLDETGAAMIARQFGVNFYGMKSERDYIDEDGVKIMVVMTTVTASFRGGHAEETGVATSRDPFVGLRKGRWLPISEISIGNLIKKSITNAKSRATKKLLGLSYTWEDLEKAGIRRDRVKKAYREGGGSIPSAGAAPSPPPSIENEDEIRQKLRGMCLDFCNGDAKAAGAFLKEQSTFTGRDGNVVEGKSRVDWLKGGWLKSTYGKVKKMYEELQQNPSPPEDDPFSHPSEPGENG